MNAVEGMARNVDAVAHGLRLIVEKWLGTDFPADLRVSEAVGMSGKRRQYVRVEVPCRSDGAALYFFLHDDGTWDVFPQEEQGLAMSSRFFAA
ncbi:hypothetical protein [Burkholderia sp. MSMB1826]|uniref:hypothetical protein n=1 Tax=Burkholderia sp. MSMB1826 TaxID=1637875 RepID=UPI000A9B07E0|nr:hypothetical protein [Burkholderia sp. MSMB1826]